MPEEVISLLAHFEITRMRTFAKIAKDEESVRQFIAEDLGIKASDGISAKVCIAKILDAWDSVSKRVQAWATAEASAKVAGEVKQIPQSSYLSLKKAYNEGHKKLEDDVFPAKPYVEWRLDQFEEGELLTEKLVDVIAADAIDNGPADVPAGHTYFDRNGKLATKKRVPKAGPPADEEQLRQRFKTVAANWQLAKFRHAGKSWLAGLTSETWPDHVEFLLSKKVLKLKGVDPAEGTSSHPTWTTVLNYDWEVRKEATRLCNEEGLGIQAALTRSQNNYEIRHRFLSVSYTHLTLPTNREV